MRAIGSDIEIKWKLQSRVYTKHKDKEQYSAQIYKVYFTSLNDVWIKRVLNFRGIFTPKPSQIIFTFKISNFCILHKKSVKLIID